MSEVAIFDSATTKLEKGVTLLEASAGTGKTFALARIFLRLVAEEGVEVGKILTVTFTTAATDELRDRIRKLLVEAHETLLREPKAEDDATISRLRTLDPQGPAEIIRRIKLAITCFDEAIISTIHGFCNQVLTEKSFETQSLFEVEVTKASIEMAKEGVQEYWRERFASVHPLISAVASSKGIKPEDMSQFFNRLPSTQDYVLGFENQVNVRDAIESLLAGFEKLKSTWLEEGSDYADYVSTCLAKNARAKSNLNRNSSILNRAFVEEEITVDAIEILEMMRASNLKPKKEFEGRSKPSFALKVDAFCVAIDSFGRAVRSDCVKYVEKKVQSWKAKRGLLFFDDLLSLTAGAVSNPDEDGEFLRNDLRDSFEAALIDEFQDTDPVQFDIFSKLFAEKKEHWLFLIGDPKQSIYRFRGADLNAYFSFARETEANKYSLNTNYRTIEPLVQSVNAFFQCSENPFLNNDLPFVPVRAKTINSLDENKSVLENGNPGPALIIKELNGAEQKEAKVDEARRTIRKDLANEIHRLLHQGTIGGRKIKAKDIAVLVRSNSDARELWKYLRKRGLVAVVFSDVSLFESAEAKELLWVLEGLVNSRDERSIRRALATGLLGKTSEDFEKWQANSKEWDRWVVRFRECVETWRTQGIYVALRELFRETKAISQNLRRPDGERRVTNFLHLAEVLHQATSQNPLSPSSLLVWLRSKIEERNSSEDEYQLRLESQSEAIQILTVHKSKGLEFPVVFLPSLSFLSGQDGDDFKYHREDGKLVVDLKKTANQETRELAQLEKEQEDARVLYVALTRAISRCYIYHAPLKISNTAKKPAQVRMMRSWLNESQICDGQDRDSETNYALSRQAQSWVENLGEQAEYISFTDNQPEFNGDENLECENSEFDSLQHESWNQQRKIPSARIVDSFSGMSKQVSFDGKDLDGVSETSDEADAYILGKKSPIFEFPAGVNAGNFMHELFENLEFSDPTNWEQFISQKLDQHQFDSRQWTPVILEMVEKVMATELQPGFSLNRLERNDRIEEMEFYFPITPGFLPELVSQLPADSLFKEYLGRLSESDYRRLEQRGYLKGLIDLIFNFNGKYWLLDWKSNKLGGHEDGFGKEQIEHEMMGHHYILQYHLYVVALHRYLQSRKANYDYEKDFGGVFYLFVRGMSKGSTNGIYFDLPDLKTVRILEDFLVTGK